MAIITCSECKGRVSSSAKTCSHCGAPKRKFKKTDYTPVLGFILALPALAVLSMTKELFDLHFGGIAPARAETSQNLSLIVCKAAIATIMNKPIEIISATPSSSVILLSYTRKADNTLWEYRCRLSSNRVIWAGKTGRWRDSPQDGVVEYSISDSTLKITESYGGSIATTKTFSLQQ